MTKKLLIPLLLSLLIGCERPKTTTAYYGCVLRITDNRVFLDCSDQAFTSIDLTVTDDQLPIFKRAMKHGKWLHIVYDNDHQVTSVSEE